MADQDTPDWAQDTPAATSAGSDTPDWAQETPAQSTVQPAGAAQPAKQPSFAAKALATAMPYFVDKNDNLSAPGQAEDIAKSGLSGLAQGTVGMFTAPIDMARKGNAYLHNAGEYLGTNAANAITGRDEKPDYWDPNSLTAKATAPLDYDSQTAAGQRAKAAMGLFGPAAASKVVGAVGDAAGYVGDVGSTIGRGWNLGKPEELAEEAANMKTSVNPVYNAMRDNGATFNQDKIEAIRSGINTALAKTDLIPELRPVTTDVVSKINAAADTGELSLNHLDQYRRLLRDASGEDSAAAGAVRNAIDNHVASTASDDLVNGSPTAVALLNRGRAEYSRAAAFDDVSTILQKANGDPTKMRTMLNNFMSKDENTAGLTSAEKTALYRASKMTGPQGVTRFLGKAGFTVLPTGNTGNGVLPYLMSTASLQDAGRGAGALAVPHGIPLVAAGTAAKAGETLYSRGLANEILDEIRNRPLPPMPGEEGPLPQLESPAIRTPPGGFGSRGQQALAPPPPVDYNPGQKQIGSQFYAPDSRAIAYQPRPDFQVTPEGWASRVPTSEIRNNPDTVAALNNAKQATQQTAKRAPQNLLTYQPRPDFIGTREGMIQNTPNLQSGDFSFGDAEGMPIEIPGELNAIRRPRQKRGGAVKTHKGSVYSRPKSYPALEAARKNKK